LDRAADEAACGITPGVSTALASGTEVSDGGEVTGAVAGGPELMTAAAGSSGALLQALKASAVKTSTTAPAADSTVCGAFVRVADSSVAGRAVEHRWA